MYKTKTKALISCTDEGAVDLHLCFRICKKQVLNFKLSVKDGNIFEVFVDFTFVCLTSSLDFKVSKVFQGISWLIG